MSGHNKWSQIKNKKGITDKKRGQLFSKLLKAIRAAAKTERNSDFNPRLRTAIETAKEANISAESIKRAVEGGEGKEMEEITVEGYGPGGAAFLCTVATDNRNRTIAELRKVFSDHEGKLAEPGSVLWAFEHIKEGGWISKFPLVIKDDAVLQKLSALTDELDLHDDVLEIFTNVE